MKDRKDSLENRMFSAFLGISESENYSRFRPAIRIYSLLLTAVGLLTPLPQLATVPLGFVVGAAIARVEGKYRGKVVVTACAAAFFYTVKFQS